MSLYPAGQAFIRKRRVRFRLRMRFRSAGRDPRIIPHISRCVITGGNRPSMLTGFAQRNALTELYQTDAEIPPLGFALAQLTEFTFCLQNRRADYC